MNNKIFKNFTRPLFSLLFCLALIILPLSISASAESDANPATEEELRVFYMNDDKSAIYDELGTYKAYTLPVGYFLSEYRAYVYSTPVDIYDPYGDVCVYTPYEGSDLYWLDGVYYYGTIFVSESTRVSVDSFINGEYSSYALSSDRVRLADMSEGDLYSIGASESRRDVDVRDLVYLKKYEIYAYDSTGAIYCTLGAVYITDDGEALYVDYTALTNNYFDADGYFSYRSGIVTASILDEGGASTLDALIDELDYPEFDYTYEEEGSDDLGGIMLVLFWVLLSVFGIVIPIIVIAVSIFLPPFLEKKRAKRIMSLAEVANGSYPDSSTPMIEPTRLTPEAQVKRAKRTFTPWTLVTIFSGTWLALGIAMLLILLL